MSRDTAYLRKIVYRTELSDGRTVTVLRLRGNPRRYTCYIVGAGLLDPPETLAGAPNDGGTSLAACRSAYIAAISADVLETDY